MISVPRELAPAWVSHTLYLTQIAATRCRI
jgi:hypothetical protein